MRLGNSKVLILFLDFLTRMIFSIPLMIDKLGGKKDTSAVENILIVELWRIGDLIIMSSILKELKNNFPSSRLSLLSRPEARTIFKNNDLIDELIEYDFPWTKFKGKYRIWNWDWRAIIKLIEQLRGEKFDLILDARGDLRNNLLSFLMKGKRRLGYNWLGGGYFLTDVVSLDYKNVHRVQAWISLLNCLKIKVGFPKPWIQVSKDEEEWADNFLRDQGVESEDLLIGIHPGARIKTRCWPLEGFRKAGEYLKDKYNAKVIVFIEPNGYGEDIATEGEFIKLKVSLRQLIILIKKVNLFICNDGGPMHIAAAVGTPLVAIFGPTNPIWFGPYDNDVEVVIKEDVQCRSCFDYCKQKEPFCITEIPVDRVLEKINKKIVDMVSPGVEN